MRKIWGALALGAMLATAAYGQSAAMPPGLARASTELANKTVPLEIFSHLPTLSGAQLSPNGQIIAARARVGNVLALTLLPVGTPGARPEIIARDEDFTKANEGEKHIEGYSWIDNDNLLVFIVSSETFQGERYDATRIASYNRITRKMTPLGWEGAIFNAGNVLWQSPPGTPQPHLLLQRFTPAYGTERLFNPEVIDIDVNTGRTRVVMRPNPIVTNWGADADGVVRVGSSSDRETGQFRILYRPNGDSNFRTILHEKADMHSPPVVPSIFLHGSNKAYAFSNKDGYRALYEYDLNTMALGAKVFGVDGYDVGGVTTTLDDSALQSIHYTDQRGRTKFVEPRLREIQSMLEEMFGAGNVEIDSADTKREKIVFTASALGQSPTVYLFDTVSGGINRLAYYNDDLKDSRLNPVAMIHYPTSDGKSVEAVLTTPRHRIGQRNLPLIIMPHGGPWVRDSADWDPYLWAQALAEQGYVVIQPNYRGSTGYGKEWGKAVEGNWGNRMQDDLNDAIPYLASQGIADPKRVCVFGWSYGGYAASRAAQRDGSKFRCAISGAGVHDLPAMIAYDKDYLGAYGAKTGLGAAGANLTAISPGLHPEQYSTPILIIHGKKDQRVPVSQSRNLVERLRRAGKVEGRDFVYVEQPLNTHNLLREEDRLQVLVEVKKFLDQHNPAYVPSDPDRPPATASIASR